MGSRRMTNDKGLSAALSPSICWRWCLHIPPYASLGLFRHGGYRHSIVCACYDLCQLQCGSYWQLHYVARVHAAQSILSVFLVIRCGNADRLQVVPNGNSSQPKGAAARLRGYRYERVLGLGVERYSWLMVGVWARD